MKYCDLKSQEGRHPIPLATQLSWVGKSHHYPTKLPELQLFFTKPSSDFWIRNMRTVERLSMVEDVRSVEYSVSLVFNFSLDEKHEENGKIIRISHRLLFGKISREDQMQTLLRQGGKEQSGRLCFVALLHHHDSLTFAAMYFDIRL